MPRSRKPSPADPTRAVAYLRVSTEDQALGPEAQRAALERWAAANGVTIVAILEDRGVSGGAELADRPGLLLALSAILEHGAGLLLVAKRDRLARDPMIAAMVEAAAARSGARVVSAAGEGTDGNDPTSILMRRIVDAFAEYERLLIRARTKSALAVKKARGERTGEIPYGYTVASDGRTLVPLVVEQAAIARMHELRAAGVPLRRVCAMLTEEGYPSRGAAWSLPLVHRLTRGQVRPM